MRKHVRTYTLAHHRANVLTSMCPRLSPRLFKRANICPKFFLVLRRSSYLKQTRSKSTAY